MWENLRTKWKLLQLGKWSQLIGRQIGRFFSCQSSLAKLVNHGEPNQLNSVVDISNKHHWGAPASDHGIEPIVKIRPQFWSLMTDKPSILNRRLLLTVLLYSNYTLWIPVFAENVLKPSIGHPSIYKTIQTFTCKLVQVVNSLSAYITHLCI